MINFFQNSYVAVKKVMVLKLLWFQCLKKWSHILDIKGHAGGIQVEFTKALCTVSQELLLGKLHAYSFSKHSLLILSSYLSNRKPRVKRNNIFRSWTDLIQGVPQRSVLGPLLFNIYLNDLFFTLKDIDVCNFADCVRNILGVLCLQQMGVRGFITPQLFWNRTFAIEVFKEIGFFVLV